MVVAGAGVGGECSRRIFGIFARAIDSQELAASSGLRWTDLTADTSHWTTAPWYFAGLFSEIFLCPIFVFDSNTLQETISKRASANVVFSYCLSALNHQKFIQLGSPDWPVTRKEAAGAGVPLPLVRVRKLARLGLGRVTAGWSHGRRPGPREAASGMRGMFLTVAARVPPRPARRHNRHDPHTCLRVLCLNSDCRDILKIQLSMGLYSESCVQSFSTIKA